MAISLSYDFFLVMNMYMERKIKIVMPIDMGSKSFPSRKLFKKR